MKPIQLIFSFAAIALALPAAEPKPQSSNVSDSGSSSATARQTGATSGSNTSTSAAMAFNNGQAYIVRDNQATPVDKAVFESNKMLTANGEWVEVRDGIAGLNRKTSNVADGGSASATARQSGSVSGSQTGANTQDGWIMQDGKLYRVENGRAKEVDQSSVPSGQMITTDGRIIAVPQGVSFDANAKGSTSSSRDTSEQNRSSSGTSSSSSATNPSADTSSGSRSDTTPKR